MVLWCELRCREYFFKLIVVVLMSWCGTFMYSEYGFNSIRS